ncbi:hypothetical protein KQI61_06105 [Anaerocolumna aminovalerica]|uniref:hypothetical protein n=1 Tax=Anaerocolumna aminovalerica TaxID=1527 RepID=UPI001C0F32F1|nr:hypothetical protein [Anaerocolumna aminovalerica]MBU5331764.1 hypothetical protein [Anaerocolumna aminovalerica]
MMITKEQKRLNSIKEIKPLLFYRTCHCCDNDFVKEKIFKVDRWGVNNSVHSWYFCKKCMSTKEDVLNEIDTDECIFGIAYVDSQVINKKDYTRINKIRDRMVR